MADSPWTFSGESTAVAADERVTLIDGTTFVVCERSGDIHGHGPFGLFMRDTRVLSFFGLSIDGSPVQPLAVASNGPFSATFAGRIDDRHLADSSIAVLQRRHVGRGLREDLEIRNHGDDPLRLSVELSVAADFESLFDVKAGREHTSTGVRFAATPGGVDLIAPDRDPACAVDTTSVTCSTPPDSTRLGILSWDVTIDPGDRWTNCIVVAIVVDGQRVEPSYACGRPVEEAIPVDRLRTWTREVATIDSGDPRLERAVRRASDDLGALRIFDPDHPERVVVAAGAPWFMTLFGRDSILASWMALLLGPELATGVLLELADSQGQKVDPTTEEEPGRILHEVRFDPASARLLGGSNTYFGTIDATPLFVMLAAELARWTGMTGAIVELMPAIDRAMEWITAFGDRDGDGFVEYERIGSTGLENQGWKDSWDGIRYGDGRVARGSIALCEVQGYVYAAYRGRAALGRALGEEQRSIDEHDHAAAELARHFDERFWLEERGCYAVGLDGAKTPIDSLTSNIGHLLWTGIVPPDRAARLADHLVSEALFSGWGLRTLAADNPGYNPLSYHCGSVWPHDTAIAIAGLARYGFDDHAQALTDSLLEASSHSGGRLPELFAGFGHDDVALPVPYPASCSPQAWAAAAPLLVARAMLGLEPDLLTGRVRLRPRISESIGELRLRGIAFGEVRGDIAVAAGSPTMVEGLPSEIEIVIDE